MGESRFAQSGRTAEQDMVERVAALRRGFDHEHESLLDLFLAGEFSEVRRSERDVVGRLRGVGGLIVIAIGQSGKDAETGTGNWNGTLCAPCWGENAASRRPDKLVFLKYFLLPYAGFACI